MINNPALNGLKKVNPGIMAPGDQRPAGPTTGGVDPGEKFQTGGIEPKPQVQTGGVEPRPQPATGGIEPKPSQGGSPAHAAGITPMRSGAEVRSQFNNQFKGFTGRDATEADFAGQAGLEGYANNGATQSQLDDYFARAKQKYAAHAGPPPPTGGISPKELPQTGGIDPGKSELAPPVRHASGNPPLGPSGGVDQGGIRYVPGKGYTNGPVVPNSTFEQNIDPRLIGTGGMRVSNASTSKLPPQIPGGLNPGGPGMGAGGPAPPQFPPQPGFNAGALPSPPNGGPPQLGMGAGGPAPQNMGASSMMAPPPTSIPQQIPPAYAPGLNRPMPVPSPGGDEDAIMEGLQGGMDPDYSVQMPRDPRMARRANNALSGLSY